MHAHRTPTLARITLAITFAAAVAAAPPGHSADARWKPERAVEIIAPTSPGAGLDTFARLIGRLLAENKLIEVPVTIVNKPGGGGAVGAAYLQQNPGDGHYLMLTNPPLLTNHIMGRNPISYTDITPLAVLTLESTMFGVRADSPLKTGRDLADRFKADPASLSVGIASAAGNHNHIAVAQMVKALGANPKSMRSVIFSGSGEAMTAMLGGHIDVINTSPSALFPHFKAGRIRILAVTAEQRLGGPFSSIPTCRELGMNVVASGWRAAAGPKGLSEAQVRYWDGVFARLAQLPEWKQHLEQRQIENAYRNVRDTRKLMDAEYGKFKTLLAELGLAK